jgi:methyl-accepting chemotaxis protein
LRSPFHHRSTLVRQLAAWQTVPEGTDAPRQDVAERLGQWLNVADAIALRALHQSLPAVKQRPRVQGMVVQAPGELQAELQRVRQALDRAITRHDADLTEHEFAPVHQHVLDLQRHMDMRIDALRDHLRQTLSMVSPRLAQLAALDAALQQLLGGREQNLLSTVPASLKARFARVRKAAEKAAESAAETAGETAGGANETTATAKAVAHTLTADLHALLRAELDLRLQPVLGMIEAYAQAFHAPTAAAPTPAASAHQTAP